MTTLFQSTQPAILFVLAAPIKPKSAAFCVSSLITGQLKSPTNEKLVVFREGKVALGASAR
jgi:hypothetical protein